ncbi:hypothetical protein C8R42DRAFT_659778 [Lentinula raphanica]|nr:hypothetical protein C8R42DRAFT_659778 [Lentinula raphanica]
MSMSLINMLSLCLCYVSSLQVSALSEDGGAGSKAGSMGRTRKRREKGGICSTRNSSSTLPINRLQHLSLRMLPISTL